VGRSKAPPTGKYLQTSSRHPLQAPRTVHTGIIFIWQCLPPLLYSRAPACPLSWGFTQEPLLMTDVKNMAVIPLIINSVGQQLYCKTYRLFRIRFLELKKRESSFMSGVCTRILNTITYKALNVRFFWMSWKKISNIHPYRQIKRVSRKGKTLKDWSSGRHDLVLYSITV
jgi:hypothetical protein